MHAGRFAALAALILLETGCGLPDSYYLRPPNVVTLAPGPGYFEFTNPVHDLTHDINVTFEGDELYYKLYASSADVEVNAYDSTNPSDAASQLTAKGFWPVCLSTDQVSSRTDPVIPESGTAASGSTVKITISATAESTYVLDSNSPVAIRRYVTDTFGTYNPYCKTFENNTAIPANYAIADTDVGSTLYLAMQASGSTVIAIYAISYGVLLDGSTPVRSIPVYLGYISISFTTG